MPTWLTKLPVVVAALAGVIAAYLLVVFEVAGLTLDDASKLGDALGPAVGLTSVVALLAALASVRLQSDALKHQKEEAARAVAEQAEEAKLNAALITTTIRYQETRPLREAYRDWLAAAQRYLDEVRAYTDYIAANPGAARMHREERQAKAQNALSSLEQLDWTTDLVDPDPERASARRRVTEGASLEPSGADTQVSQRDNAADLFAWHAERISDLHSIHDSLKSMLRPPP